MLISSVLTALLLAQAPPAAVPRPGAPQTDETIPVQKGARLLVNNFAGDVVVRTWEKDAVHVVARHQARTRVSVRTTGVGVSINASASNGPQGSVDYEITAPAWMPMRIEGTYNFVTVEGAQAEVYASTMRGDVTIKGGAGTVTAKSVEGEIRLEGARGKVTASSVNEKIVITDAGGEIAADSTNGAITMRGIDAKIVDASTVNGDILYEGRIADGGHYGFGTHNGSVSLGIPDQVNATFTIRTYQGSFSSDFPLEGIDRKDVQRGRRVTAALGNGSADVSLETFGGSIRLRKGSAVRTRER